MARLIKPSEVITGDVLLTRLLENSEVRQECVVLSADKTIIGGYRMIELRVSMNMGGSWEDRTLVLNENIPVILMARN